jgi:DNA-binding CsgD family transcriptional regulator
MVPLTSSRPVVKDPRAVPRDLPRRHRLGTIFDIIEHRSATIDHSAALCQAVGSSMRCRLARSSLRSGTTASAPRRATGSATGLSFDLDEYVYAALRAGASGFVLKDDPLEQLIAAIRIVAHGEALLSPTITKRVIEQFARIPQPTPPRQLEELTERELDVFRLIARGLSNAEISQQLYISDTTVKTHITHILQKLNLRDRVQAVILAYETGLFTDDVATIESA